MPVRYIVTGLENGKKRTVEWLDGVLTGDDDLIARYEARLAAVDAAAFREGLPGHRRESWEYWLHDKILCGELFAEVLDIECAQLSTTEELQERADAWNGHEGETHHYTVEELRQMEEEDARERHRSPPYAWEEIESVLAAPEETGESDLSPPEQQPKCLECFQPMTWIWFFSSAETWEALCGRAGWVPICRECRTWRRCEERVMS